jgi:hypothetical protein
MDVVEEPVLFLPSGGPLRPWQDTEARTLFVTEDPRLVRAMATPGTEFLPKGRTGSLKNERRGNLYENKGVWKTRGLSWNVHENKGDIIKIR